jgi:DNA-binding transcriptional LysR family regulator
MIGLTFRQLEVFLAIVECGGVPAAAEKLGISQVSVTEHLKALERHCGTVLLRRGRGMKGSLSDAGMQAYLTARELIESAGILSDLGGSRAARGSRRRIRIAVNEYIAELIGTRLAAFAAEFSIVDLEQERRTFEGVLQGLRDGEIEMGAFFSFGPVPEFESFEMWQEELGFYTAPNHPLARRTGIKPEDLLQYPFAQLPAHTHMRRQLDSLFGRLGLGKASVIMTGESQSLVEGILSKGEAIACLFVLPSAAAVESGHLRKLDLAFEVPSIDARYVVRAPFHLDPLVQKLAAYLAPSSETQNFRPFRAAS